MPSAPPIVIRSEAPPITITTESPTATATMPAATEQPSSTPSAESKSPSTGGTTASTMLEEIPIKGRAPKTGYERSMFGSGWGDTDHNGCDTRNDILNRDLTVTSHKAGTRDCVVLTGSLDDPYTGETIEFQRGQGTSNDVQIDHVVALSDAWQKGAQKLSAEQRLEFANDPLNLLAVDGPTNGSKGDGDAATWLPPNKGFWCDYVTRQIEVKHKYDLWMTKAEAESSRTVLEERCV
ncbi:lipoprotein [Arthrobacter sp. LS16]|nr:lipoprotein [Arthrobacter sp. LS16]